MNSVGFYNFANSYGNFQNQQYNFYQNSYQNQVDQPSFLPQNCWHGQNYSVQNFSDPTYATSYFPPVYDTNIQNSTLNVPNLQPIQNLPPPRNQSTPKKKPNKHFVKKPLREIPLADMTRDQLRNKVKNLEHAFTKAQSRFLFEQEEHGDTKEALNKMKQLYEKEKAKREELESENSKQIHMEDESLKEDEDLKEKNKKIEALEFKLDDYKRGSDLIAKQYDAAREINQSLNKKVFELEKSVQDMKNTASSIAESKENDYLEMKEKYEKLLASTEKTIKSKEHKELKLLERHTDDWVEVRSLKDKRDFEAYRYAKFETHHHYLKEYLENIDKRLVTHKIPRIQYEKTKDPEIIKLSKAVFSPKTKSWSFQSIDMEAKIKKRHPERYLRPTGDRGERLVDPLYKTYTLTSEAELMKEIDRKIKVKIENVQNTDEELLDSDKEN